jgi:hypothetical protein
VDLIGNQRLGVRVGDDKCAVAVDQGHSVGERESVGDLVHAAVRRDANDRSCAAVHVRVADGVDHEFVGRARAEAAEVRDGSERPIRLQL